MAEELDLFAGDQSNLDLFQDQDLFAGQATAKPFEMTPEAYQRPGMKTEQPVYVPPPTQSFMGMTSPGKGEGAYVLPSERKARFEDVIQGAKAGVPGFLTGLANIPSEVYNAVASRV